MVSAILLPPGSQGLGALLHPDETASVFASDVTRRIHKAPIAAETAPEGSPEALEAAKESARKDAQLGRLESALAGTVSWMSEKHGDAAATALMGIVYKRLGEGDVTEESLGDAFLDVTRFIDKQFGTGAGDDFLDHLNGSLNDSLNAYFDNSRNETFMAVTTPAGSAVASVGGGLVSGAIADLNEQVKNSVQQIIDDIRKLRPQAENGEQPYGQQEQTAMIGVMQDSFV